MRSLYVSTRDYNNIAYTLWDAVDLVFTTRENGFYDCTFTLPRQYDRAYDDIGSNFQLYIRSARGDVAWHGRIEAIDRTRDYSNGKKSANKIVITGLGYWASLYDVSSSGLPIPTQDKPENTIFWFFDTYADNQDDPNRNYPSGFPAPRDAVRIFMPQIANCKPVATGYSAAADYAATGNSDYLLEFSYHVNSGSERRIGDIVLDQCQWGTSSGNKVIPAVWEDRILITSIIPDPPTARYQLREVFIQSMTTERRLSLIANRVRAWYIPTVNGTKILLSPYPEDTVTENEMAIDFGNGVKIPYIRNAAIDMSSNQGNYVSAPSNAPNAIASTAMRAQTVQQRCTAILNSTKLPQASGDIVVTKGYALYDTVLQQDIPLWQVRSGNWLAIPDLIPRPSDGGTGTPGGDLSISNMFYISQTSYKIERHHTKHIGYWETEELTITPDLSNKAADLIS